MIGSLKVLKVMIGSLWGTKRSVVCEVLKVMR